MSHTDSWRDDPALGQISKAKLDFLQNMLFESKKYSDKELFPFFMSLAVKSRSQNISFTEEEINTIIPVLKKYATPEEIGKMNQVIGMLKSRR